MARVETVAGYPVRQYTSPNRSTDTMSDHRGVVLHIAEGYFEGTISWQMNPDQKLSDGTPYNTCSTWIVGQDEGEIAQMVDSDEIAWCQRSGSRTWLSIELSGYTTQAYVPTDWQRRACAELFVWSHKRYGHPLTIADTDADRGLGHHSMDREWAGVEWGHEQCPGQYVIAAKPDILRIAQAINNGEDVDMPLTDAEIEKVANRTVAKLLGADSVPWTDTRDYSVGGAINDGALAARNVNEKWAPLLASAIAAVAAKVDAQVDVDEPAIAAAVLAGLDPAKIAAAIPDDLAQRVADELHSRLAG